MATSYYQHRYYYHHDEDDENTPLIPVLSSSPSMAFSLVGRKRSAITNTTLIAVSITIVANIIAQYLEINYAHHVTSTPSTPDHPNVPAVVPVRQAYDPWRVLQFGTWALISTPPLFRWQQFLERTFPAYFPEEKVLKVHADDEGAAYTTQKKRNWKNTGTKVLLEQVCAAPINCTIFLFTIKALAGGSITQCIGNIHDKFWQVKLAGYRVWPVVSIFNMTFVPVDRRIIVTNIIGLLWQIFLALRV